jgi:hypothetical protein
MSNRLLWAAVVIVLIDAAILYFATNTTTNQPANERPSPHAINQGNG